MYNRPRRRRDTNRTAGARARGERLMGHKPEAVLRRHVCAAHAVQAGSPQAKQLLDGLLATIADPPMLMAALGRIGAAGGEAPGPNGLRLKTLSRSERWDLARSLGQTLADGTYRHGPVRKKQIRKPGRAGNRTLTIENLQDRIVAKTALLAISPIVEPQLDERSHGARPGRGRDTAVWQAEQIARDEGRLTFVTADLTQAFDRVPRGRVLSALRRYLPNDAIDLIRRIMGDRGTGLPQGSALSPLLLNVYLNHALERPWRRAQRPPMIRVVDDLLVLCKHEGEAEEAINHLRCLLNPTGMRLRDDATQVRNLGDGQTVGWLGYEIAWEQDALTTRISEKSWESLATHLDEAHTKACPSRCAQQTVVGWITQQAATYPHMHRRETTQRVREIAAAYAWEELPPLTDLQRGWRRAYRRLLRRRGLWEQLTTARGSATAIFSNAVGQCGDRPSREVRSSASRGALLRIFTDGGHREAWGGISGWAFVILEPSGRVRRRCRGTFLKGSNQAAELRAAVRAIEATPVGSRVRLLTDSEYVSNAINEYLAIWRAQGWRAGSPGSTRPLRHAGMWIRLGELLESRQVECRWIRGHSGNHWNEVCDRAASEAIEVRRLRECLSARQRRGLTAG